MRLFGEVFNLCDLFVYFLHLTEVFNQGKVMCCDLRSVGDKTIYLRLLQQALKLISPNIMHPA